MYRLTAIIAFFSLFCATTNSLAQNSLARKIQWEMATISNNDGKTSQQLESFSDATFDYSYKNLSFYTEKFKGSYQSFEIVNPKYELALQKFDVLQKTLISTEATLEFSPVYEQKSVSTLIRILPYRKNESGGIEKLVSFDIRAVKGINKSIAPQVTRTYANNSVLQSGNWYKLGIGTTGIYKLGYEQLQNLGIAVDQINPKNIRVYGNGGGILPEGNYIARYDDLQENAIQVIGEDDGAFNKGDYILFYAKGPNNVSIDYNNKVLQNNTNPYTTESFYFITSDLGIGKRMSTQGSSTNTTTVNINDYNYFEYYEKSLNTGVNATIKSGRERYGEEFNNQTSYDFNFNIPDINTSQQVAI